jgi:hypothetical protein
MPAANTIAPLPSFTIFYHISFVGCNRSLSQEARSLPSVQAFFAPERCKTLPHLLYF